MIACQLDIGDRRQCLRACTEADGCYWDRVDAEIVLYAVPDVPIYADTEVETAYKVMLWAMYDFQAYARPGSWRKFKNLQTDFEKVLSDRLRQAPSWKD